MVMPAVTPTILKGKWNQENISTSTADTALVETTDNTQLPLEVKLGGRGPLESWRGLAVGTAYGPTQRLLVNLFNRRSTRLRLVSWLELDALCESRPAVMAYQGVYRARVEAALLKLECIREWRQAQLALADAATSGADSVVPDGPPAPPDMLAARARLDQAVKGMSEAAQRGGDAPAAFGAAARSLVDTTGPLEPPGWLACLVDGKTDLEVLNAEPLTARAARALADNDPMEAGKLLRGGTPDQVWAAWRRAAVVCGGHRGVWKVCQGLDMRTTKSVASAGGHPIPNSANKLATMDAVAALFKHDSD